MPVAWHPPHRSQRAILSHWAPALSHHAKTLFWIRMIDAGDREPLVHVPLHTLPGNIAFVAPSRETTLPQPCNFLAESLQRLGVMRYAIVLIMAQYHRSEPSPLYRDGKVHSPPELAFHLSQLGAKALRDGAPFQPLGVIPLLKAHHHIVNIPHQADIALCVSLTPLVSPEVKHIIQIDVGRQRGKACPLGTAYLTRCPFRKSLVSVFARQREPLEGML